MILFSLELLFSFKVLLFMFSQNKQVAFAVRTNVSYESSAGDNSPSLDKTVSFAMKDFLHIKEVRCL